MGCYINPLSGTKEEWLEKHATAVLDHAPHWHYARIQNALPVCLVDNGQFTAAGISFSENEMRAFAYPDGRPKMWFIVPIKDLLEVEPSLKAYMNASD